jgi:simple sugar transport system substrate-binding protein
MKFSKRNFLLLLTAAGFGLSNTVLAADPIKAAWVYFGTPGDAGWTYAHGKRR